MRDARREILITTVSRGWRTTLPWLVRIHRWVGISLCLYFVLLCASGTVLLFVPYPELSYADWIRNSAPIDFARVTHSPAQAFEAAGGGTSIELIDLDGTPAYIVTTAAAAGHSLAISAQTGERIDAITPQQARSIAEAFEGAGKSVRLKGPFTHDPWTTRGRFSSWRPFYEVGFDDPERTSVYVTARTGEVVQRTEAWERRWTWIGGTLHWIYFVPLVHAGLWDPLNWTLGLTAIVLVVLGIWLGLYRTSRHRNSGKPGLSSYRGWMRRHHIFGLAAGLLLLSYLASGWLSFDHGRMFSTDPVAPERLVAYQGGALPAVAAPVTLDHLRAMAPASRIRVVGVNGSTALSAEGGGEPVRSAIVDRHGTLHSVDAVPDELIALAAAAAWPENELRPVAPASADDVHVLYQTTNRYQGAQIAGNALVARLRGPAPMRLYIDDASGRVVTAKDPAQLLYDWLYWGLHTFNFPGLSARPTAKLLIELTSVATIFGFVVTAIIIAVRRLRMATSR